jgi:drug/metabolite transporter (DMT)-like permease
MKASSFCFVGAVLCAVVGMVMGLYMAVSGDHTQHPAHAHLNLLGWVTLFLYGIYYRLQPEIDRGKPAIWQARVALGSVVVMTFGLWFLYAGADAAEPLAAVGSLGAFAALLVFAWIVIGKERATR